MTRDEIVKLANLCDLNRVCGPLDTLLDHEWEDLHRFAELAVAAEREACARVCEQWGAWNDVAQGCAEAIRSRGIANEATKEPGNAR